VRVYVVGEPERYGVHVRVKPEVEELVRLVANHLGYLPYTMRNAAILYGLATILLARRVPDTDAEFLELLEKVRALARQAKLGS